MKDIQVENGYTRIANELYEATMGENLSSYELRVLHCIIRKTYGYGKKEDRIALSQITAITHITKTHISRTIKKLVSYGIVTHTGNLIGVNKDLTAWKVTKPGNSRKLPIEVTRVAHRGNKKLPIEALQKKERNYHKRNIDKSIGEKSPEMGTKKYGNPEIDLILEDFKKLTGHIPSDRKPRQVAQNIRMRLQTFLRDNGPLFFELRGEELTRGYVLKKFYNNLMQKNYIDGLEKLDTVRLKLIVYLDDIHTKLTEEKKTKFNLTEGGNYASYQTN